MYAQNASYFSYNSDIVLSMGEIDRPQVFLSQEKELIREHFPHFATQAIHTGQDPEQCNERGQL